MKKAIGQGMLATSKNSRGRGFDSCQLLGFFSTYISLISPSLTKSLKEVQHY